VVRPLQLEVWGRAWTLTAWCEDRSDFRVFRVDLIDALDLRGPFRPDPGTTVEDYIARLAEDP
jgi:predicted DNA-binding transcriptional regulator YafY